jgi:hypothetical protein
VDIYRDETIGDLKALLHKKHNINIDDSGRLLISLPLSADFPDSNIIFNLDLSKIYSMAFSRTIGIAPRAYQVTIPYGSRSWMPTSSRTEQ